jgi:adenine-specific DNA glycosylase
MSPRRNLKTTEDGTRKGTEQSGYQFKKYRTPACKNCPVNHLCTSRTAGREIDRSEYAKAWKKITNAIRKPAIMNSAEINEHIFGTIKDNGVTINLTGLEK